MVSNASEDFPDPEIPVSTARRSRGISTVMFWRLCSRAPRTMIRSRGMTASYYTPIVLCRPPPCRGPRSGDALSGPSPPDRSPRPGSRPAGPASGSPAASPRTGEEWLAHPFAQLLNLVPQHRRLLELQLGGGLPHLAFQGFDRPLELGGAQHQQAGDVPGDARALLLGQPDQFRRGVDLPFALLPRAVRGGLLGDLGQIDQVADRLDDRLRGDPVLLIVLRLNRPAAVGLVDGLAHGLGDLVRVQHDPAGDVSRGPAHCLDQAGLRPQIALL